MTAYHDVIHDSAVTRARQERWLHARISEDLEDALRREARRQRRPVSMLVRDVLEGALDLVEELVGEGLEVARRSQRIAPRAAGHHAAAVGDDIYGWQELILNRATGCARCQGGLEVGTSAYRGLRDRPGPPVFLCIDCVGRLRRPASAEEERT